MSAHFPRNRGIKTIQSIQLVSDSYKTAAPKSSIMIGLSGSIYANKKADSSVSNVAGEPGVYIDESALVVLQDKSF